MPIEGKANLNKDHSFTNFPITISNNVKSSVSNWSVEGNSVQNGTPTPDTPIQPEFVGVRTGNLFDISTIIYRTWTNGSGVIQSYGYGARSIDIPSSQITVSFNGLVFPYSYSIVWVDSNGGFITSSHIGSATQIREPQTFTPPSNAAKFYIQLSNGTDSTNLITEEQIEGYKLMLNLGNTALPYEPFGWAEKITCAGQTVPVYLGQVNTVRRIKKLVLTGEENVTSGHLPQSLFNIGVTEYKREVGLTMLFCSHYVSLPVVDAWTEVNDMCVAFYGGTPAVNLLYIRDSRVATITDFKSYLAAQYAAGTPVTVWYVLAEPITGIVNEPLCKIGNYSDELLSTSEGTPQLTLLTEEPNLISFETNLQPSKFNIKYYEEGYAKIKDIQMQIPTTKTYNSIRYVLDNNNNYIYKSPYFYTWEGIREIVRAGKASQYYPIGSIIYDNFNESTGTAFQVVAYDNHFDPTLTAQGYTHSMTLCELLLTDVIKFDEIEAFLYTDTIIPAGTYRFTIPNYDATYGGNKTYYFTSTSDLPVESQLVINWPYNQTPKTVTAYSPSGTTLVQNITTATSGWNDLTLNEYIEGTSPAAIDLGTIAGPSTQLGTSNYGEMNHIHRARYGSNNYLQSGIRQYINSNSAANTWWEPQTIFDRPYTTRTSAGKLTKLDSNLVNVMAKPEIESRTNSYFETTSLDGTTFTLATDYSITNDKMFLLAPVEVGFSTTDTTVGTLLDYYSEATDETRIKKRKSNNTAYYWWLRTPYPSNANSERYVNSSGALYSYYANSSRGVAAACVIQ